MRKSIIAIGSSFALLLGLLVGTSATSSAATLRVPKTSFPACAQVNGVYCVESVVITTGQGKTVPLMWVPNGNPVPSAPANAGISFAPIAQLNKSSVVVKNNWWTDQYQRDVLTSGTEVFMDVSSLINGPKFPDQGAIYDSTTKAFDITKTTDFFSSSIGCWDAATKTTTQKAWSDCYKGALVVIKDGKVQFEFDYTTALQASLAVASYSTSKFVDLKASAELQQMPDIGAKYDSVAKTFDKMVSLVTPIWVTNGALVNGWAVAGTVATQPTAVDASPSATPSTSASPSPSASASSTASPSATPSDSTSASPAPSESTSTGVAPAPLAPDANTAVSPLVEAGRALSGRWTTPGWNTLNLGNLGYDGLFVDAKAANEFSNNLFFDVVPTLTDNANKVNLASQPGSKGYASNLDSDITIKVTVRTGDLKTGVTVAIGVDTTVTTLDKGDYTQLTIEGSAVTVPLAANAATDCSSETGVAKANVRQFQTLIIPQNDQTGFGIDGITGNLYVGTNGVCSLSTPIWDQSTKSFSWDASAPHFASDGVTVNKGFYKAVIPFKDAALLWGLTNPADAATALKVSVTTQAGGSSAAISVISAKNNNIIIDVSGFSYSKPHLKITLQKGYKPSKKKIASLPAPKYTLTCALGATTKKITGTKPVCPTGYKKVGGLR
ncbi:MAG: hypothetical protein WCO08_08825 [Actinomycetes bacterium]